MRVSAGIVRRKDGRMLICKRGVGRNNAHLWEFPGGKQEAGESAQECLQRELMEELMLPVVPGRIVRTEEKQGILFDFVEAETVQEPQLTEHEAMAWVTPREMLGYRFCPADTETAHWLALQNPRVRNFLWDFDGTLMDTYPALIDDMLQAADSMGMRTNREEVTALMMQTQRRCVQVLAEKYGGEAETLHEAFKALEKNTRPEDTPPISGIRETLEALRSRGGRHYLVTHRDESAWRFLEAWGMRKLFDGGVTWDAGRKPKPAPDMVLHVMREHGLAPEETMMIGDRPLDTEAGRRAGTLSCMLDTSGFFPEDPAEFYARSAVKLENVLWPE